MDEVAFGRYRLVELIGEGGMGQVFRAHDTVIGRDVAIKVLPPEMATLPGYQERFRREAQVAARLTEPHIIPIHDTGEIDGRLYLVMPIIDGIDVHTVLAREGPMAPPRAVRVIQQLAAALNVAHRNGLVHRDIKPSNALMTPDEHVYLIDFGIAHDTSATRMTQTGMMIGTFSYMAPERFLTGTVDARADVYALACVLHECLTGARPFPGDSMEQQIAGHLSAEPPRPSALNAGVPPAFDEVIARGMAKQPNERYQSAGELSAAAQHALNAPPVSRPAPPPPRPQPPPQPRPSPPPRPDAGLPHQTTQVAPTQRAAFTGDPTPARISGGAFASVLVGTILVSLAAWSMATWWTPRWVLNLAVIPGLALLVLGRGRGHAQRTITGCALVTLGSGTLLGSAFGVPPTGGVAAVAALAGLPLMLIPLYARPSRQLSQGGLICGAGILALTAGELLVDFIDGELGHGVGRIALGAITGAVVAVAAGVAYRRAGVAAGSTPPESSATITAGRFTSLISGVVLVCISTTELVVPWGSWASGYVDSTSYATWVIIAGAVPGIVLLALGRGRRHAGRTIAGTALVSVALSTIALGQFSSYNPDPIVAALPGVIGLLLILIPMFQRPTRSVGFGCLSAGSYVLALNLVYTALPSIYWSTWGEIGAASALGVILTVAGGIALALARRRKLPVPAPGSERAGQIR